jgi:hypothetical protein
MSQQTLDNHNSKRQTPVTITVSKGEVIIPAGRYSIVELVETVLGAAQELDPSGKLARWHSNLKRA